MKFNITAPEYIHVCNLMFQAIEPGSDYFNEQLFIEGIARHFGKDTALRMLAYTRLDVEIVEHLPTERFTHA